MKTFLLISFLATFIIATGQSQQISMQNGLFGYKFYEGNIRISKKEAIVLVNSDEEAKWHWEKYKQHRNIAWISSGVGMGFYVWALSILVTNSGSKLAIAGVIATTGLSVGYSSSSLKHKREAFSVYNENQELSTMNLVFTSNGIGVVINF